MSVHEQENALDWLDENQLAELSYLKSYDRATFREPRSNHILQGVNVFSLFELESVNEGHPDKISETTACWSFRVLLTVLASKL